MAKFKVKTAELIADLEKKIAQKKSERDSYWVDKTNYDNTVDDLLNKALYKTYENKVTHYHVDGENFVYHARIPLASMGVVEFPKSPKLPTAYEINKLETHLTVYKMCEDETISLSDSELKAIFGD